MFLSFKFIIFLLFRLLSTFFNTLSLRLSIGREEELTYTILLFLDRTKVLGTSKSLLFTKYIAL